MNYPPVGDWHGKRDMISSSPAQDTEKTKEFTQKIEQIFNRASRHGSGETEKKYRSLPEFCERFSRKIKAFASAIEFDTTDVVPTLTVDLIHNEDAFVVTFNSVQIDDEPGISLREAENLFGDYQRDYSSIGYDIEFLADTKTIVSHQFSFATPHLRFGVTFLTDYRFTDASFKTFLATLLQTLNGTKRQGTDAYPKKWLLSSHFAIAEGSYIDNSEESLIPRADKSWGGSIELYTIESTKKDGTSRCIKIEQKKDDGTLLIFKGIKEEKVTLQFIDTVRYMHRSLAAAAEQCGMNKHTLLPEKYKDTAWFKRCSDSVYRNINKFKGRRFDRYIRYANRDANLSAAIPILIHAKMYSFAQLGFADRMAKYSEKWLVKFMKETYSQYENWQELFGQVPGYLNIGDGKKRKQYVPSREQRKVFEAAYAGGRNECRRVGVFKDKSVVYWDMTSAYPMAIAALKSMYNFTKYKKYLRSTGAAERVDQLMKHGPFQPHTVRVYALYKDHATPMTPVKTDGAIIFPRENDVTTMCWPEFWTAVENKLFEDHEIFRLDEYEPIVDRRLPEAVLDMVRKRKDDPLLYKNLANFLYGKMSQGADGIKPYSSVTCPILASYITSVTRACAGELANVMTDENGKADYYAITTDGFISPQAELRFGPTNQLMADLCTENGITWLKNDFQGDTAVFLKTRGYILIDSTKGSNAPWTERFKQAKFGLQGSEPADILKQIRDGVGIRRRTTGFSGLDDGEIFQMIDQEFKVNPAYDWKFVVLEESIDEKEVTIDGITLSLVTFDTRPLKNIAEYEHLRHLAKYKSIINLEARGTKALIAKDYRELYLTYQACSPIATHMAWEFRKTLARHVTSWKETSLSHQQHYARFNKPEHDIPRKYGELSEFDWIFNQELKIVKDAERRKALKQSVLADMEKRRVDDPGKIRRLKAASA